MADYSIFWTDRAYESLRQVHDFLLKSSPTGAKQVVQELVKHSQTLKNLPRRQPVEPVLETAPVEYRFLIKWHYKIIYTILEEEQMVLIVLVFDSRRDPAKLKI